MLSLQELLHHLRRHLSLPERSLPQAGDDAFQLGHCLRIVYCNKTSRLLVTAGRGGDSCLHYCSQVFARNFCVLEFSSVAVSVFDCFKCVHNSILLIKNNIHTLVDVLHFPALMVAKLLIKMEIPLLLKYSIKAPVVRAMHPLGLHYRLLRIAFISELRHYP